MIAAGFGFREGATADSLADALGKAAGGVDIDVVATAADKATDKAFQSISDDLDVAVAAVAPTHLRAQDTITHSEASLVARGTGSVAEAAALAAAGPGATLIGPRVTSDDRMATCALAEGKDL